MQGTKLRVATVTAALAVAVFGLASPARAESPAPALRGSSPCLVGTSGTCNSNAIQATGGGIILNLNTPVVNSCRYRVVDVANGAVVREDTFRGPRRVTISGLYSWYQLQMRGCVPGSYGLIID